MPRDVKWLTLAYDHIYVNQIFAAEKSLTFIMQLQWNNKLTQWVSLSISNAFATDLSLAVAVAYPEFYFSGQPVDDARKAESRGRRPRQQMSSCSILFNFDCYGWYLVVLKPGWHRGTTNTKRLLYCRLGEWRVYIDRWQWQWIAILLSSTKNTAWQTFHSILSHFYLIMV